VSSTGLASRLTLVEVVSVLDSSCYVETSRMISYTRVHMLVCAALLLRMCCAAGSSCLLVDL
jgi:hypothetical protein